MASRKFTQEQWTRETEQSEEYLVFHIKMYLLTEGQRLWLFKKNLSIEDVLNGRYPLDMTGEMAEKLFKPWNEKLGWVEFGRGSSPEAVDAMVKRTNELLISFQQNPRRKK